MDSLLRPRILAVLFVIAGCPLVAHAQDQPFTAAVRACLGVGRACADLDRMVARQADTPAAGTIDARDGAFHFVVGSFITAAGADIAVSMYQIGRGAARERGFGAAWQDSPVPFAITKSGLTAVFAYGLQRIHAKRPKTALVLGLAATAVEVSLVARAATIRPSDR
jgi:hypothetical protein